MPLQEAWKYIGDEAKVKTDIDGDALKDAGFTKNMAQTFLLGEVPAINAIHALLEKYEPEKISLVVIIDEEKKLMLLTTDKFAKRQGLKVHPVKPIEIK